MPTPNRGYNLPERGDENWDVPLNENFSAIDEDIQAALDAAAALDEILVENSGAPVGSFTSLNFGTDLDVADDGTGTATISSTAASVALADADGIDTRRRNVGAMIGGTYHGVSWADGGPGVVFAAQDLHIASVVVDADLTNVTDATQTIELRQYQSGAASPTIVDSTTLDLATYVTGSGAARIPLGFDVPATGAGNADPNDEYVLQRGPESVPLRRRWSEEGDFSAADFTEQTYADPPIDFLRGANNASTFAGSDPSESWYYFFDWLVGPEADRVTSPWSTDVDEIYMRPTDPLEEFDDVSPRALWIDTSGV